MFSIIHWIYFSIFIISAYVYLTMKQQYDFWKKKGVKYIKPKFLLGNMSISPKSLASQVQEVYEAYPEDRYHGIFQLTLPILVIKDPDLIKQITVGDFDHFVNHCLFANDNGGDPFWSKNLLGCRDEKWRKMRSTLSPSFTGSKMKIMFTLMEECAQQFVDHFKKINQEIIEIEVKDVLTRYTCDVIATTAFGLKCNSLENKNNKFFQMGKHATSFSGVRLLRFLSYTIIPNLAQFFKIRITPAIATNYFSKIIEDTVTTRKKKKIARPDMIHLLLEAQKYSQKEITLDDISAQAFVYFFAGFETNSNFLTFTFYELALNTAIQTRLREEIRSGQVTYESLQSLKFLDMVMCEVLRKWPPFPVTDREVSKGFTIEPVKPEEKRLYLEKGVVCWLPIFALHNDPKNFPNPRKFDPERFSDENKHKIVAGTYLPFGVGPRNCIGARFAVLESKLIVAHVLKDFEIVKIGKTEDPVVLHKFSINITPKNGLWLGLKKIDH